MSRTGTRDRGFTLVELLTVMTIISILAAISTVAYRKFVGRARVGEAVALLAEMSSKEVLYYSEFALYYPLRNEALSAQPSPDESAAMFYPISPSNPIFDSARVATDISNSGAWPLGWRNLGIRPMAQALYCSYLLNAGGAGTSPPALPGLGSQMLCSVTSPCPVPTPWFYALAVCNLSINGPGGMLDGWPGQYVTVFALTHNSPQLRTFNEGM